MEKINITLKGTEYQIDKSALTPATTELQVHLQTKMSGSGAVINLGGNAYSVDSAKLTNETNEFVSHLGAISGSGSKVVVNGTEYSVDAAKTYDATNELNMALNTLSDNPNPVARAAGLYATGTNIKKATWSDLIAKGTIHVDNGVVYTNMNASEWTNSSSGALTGDLVLPDDGSITAIGDAYYDENSNLTGSHGFCYCVNLTGITIPNSVTSIGYRAFRECNSLTSIEIPDSVITIGYAAFEYCRGLINVVIGNSVTTIDPYAFNDCSNLTSVVIPDSVTEIGYQAFQDCSSLTSVVIPDSVTSIGSYTFAGCRSLTDIQYAGTKEQWKAIIFGNNWNSIMNDYIITCTDGTIAKDGTET